MNRGRRGQQQFFPSARSRWVEGSGTTWPSIPNLVQSKARELTSALGRASHFSPARQHASAGHCQVQPQAGTSSRASRHLRLGDQHQRASTFSCTTSSSSSALLSRYRGRWAHRTIAGNLEGADRSFASNLRATQHSLNHCQQRVQLWLAPKLNRTTTTTTANSPATGIGISTVEFSNSLDLVPASQRQGECQCTYAGRSKACSPSTHPTPDSGSASLVLFASKPQTVSLPPSPFPKRTVVHRLSSRPTFSGPGQFRAIQFIALLSFFLVGLIRSLDPRAIAFVTAALAPPPPPVLHHTRASKHHPDQPACPSAASAVRCCDVLFATNLRLAQTSLTLS
ncbi:hypothetical protein LIA77_08654 [Sarocladium implicatum]|nr:hypothetical protein LIA77_08654 [Sarocladium implicatum]